jgi:uncharacterized membrane protein YuzA (DUF378 family)
MDNFMSKSLPEINEDLFKDNSKFSLLYMIMIVFAMNIGFILLARRARLQRMTMLCGTSVVIAVVFYMLKTIAGLLYGNIEIVLFE